MAFPTVVSRNTHVGPTSNSTTYTAGNLPLGGGDYQTGDLLVVCVSADGNPTLSVNVGASEANFTKLDQASNGTAVTGAIFYLPIDGSTSGPIQLKIGRAHV